MPQGSKGLSLRVRLPYRSEEELLGGLGGFGRSLSRTSMFVATESAKPAGTMVSLDVVIADGRSVLRGEAVVTNEVPRGRPGMWLRFIELDAHGREFLDRAFSTRAERAERVVLGVDPGATATRVAMVKDGRVAPVARGPGADESGAFRATLATARDQLELPIARAVLAVPAHFGQRQREAMRESAAAAGWRVEQVVSAPTAIAVAYAAGRALPRRRLCVIDFGSRKLDVSIVEAEGDEVGVLACGGDASFAVSASGTELLDRMERVVRNVLAGAQLTPKALDVLVLGGAMARLPEVRERLVGGLGHAPEEIDAEWGVAFGAALIGEAHTRPDGVSVNDLVPESAAEDALPASEAAASEGAARA
jgi:hypothetical protein